MSKLLIVFWLLLLGGQVYFGFLAREKERRPAGDAADPGLVALARSTRESWDRWLPVGTPPAGVPAGGSPAEEMVRQQSLLLQLREAERLIRSTGAEVDLLEVIEPWLDRENLNHDPAAASDFLRQLIEWMKPFLEGGNPCRLERLSIHPDASSRFPALAFELGGEPGRMARSLLELNDGNKGWTLRELDLYRPDPAADWWLRGSCRFAQQGLR